MSDIDETLTVTRNDEAGRYEVHVGPVLAGYTEFSVDAHGRLVFPHTAIDHAYRGRGLANVLVEGAMRDAAARGETVEPICPVVRRWLRHNTVPGLEIVWPLWTQDEADDAAPG